MPRLPTKTLPASRSVPCLIRTATTGRPTARPGRRVRHIDIPPRMFMKALRVYEKRLGFDLFVQSGLRHYLPETALGTWEVGGPTTHVRDVAGVEPEDFLTIARRYVTGPESRRTAGNLIRQGWNFMLTSFVPMHRLDTFDRL